MLQAPCHARTEYLCCIAAAMLKARHAAERLQNAWHGGLSTIDQLRASMQTTLAEFVSSHDEAEVPATQMAAFPLSPCVICGKLRIYRLALRSCEPLARKGIYTSSAECSRSPSTCSLGLAAQILLAWPPYILSFCSQC